MSRRRQLALALLVMAAVSLAGSGNAWASAPKPSPGLTPAPPLSGGSVHAAALAPAPISKPGQAKTALSHPASLLAPGLHKHAGASQTGPGGSPVRPSKAGSGGLAPGPHKKPGGSPSGHVKPGHLAPPKHPPVPKHHKLTGTVPFPAPAPATVAKPLVVLTVSSPGPTVVSAPPAPSRHPQPVASPPARSLILRNFPDHMIQSGGAWQGPSLRTAGGLLVPIVFGLAVATFLIVQALIDRKDPKYSRAPETGRDDTLGFS